MNKNGEKGNKLPSKKRKRIKESESSENLEKKKRLLDASKSPKSKQTKKKREPTSKSPTSKKSNKEPNATSKSKKAKKSNEKTNTTSKSPKPKQSNKNQEATNKSPKLKKSNKNQEAKSKSPKPKISDKEPDVKQSHPTLKHSSNQTTFFCTLNHAELANYVTESNTNCFGNNGRFNKTVCMHCRSKISNTISVDSSVPSVTTEEAKLELCTRFIIPTILRNRFRKTFTAKHTYIS